MMDKKQGTIKIQKFLKSKGFEISIDGEWSSDCEEKWQYFITKMNNMENTYYLDFEKFPNDVIREIDQFSSELNYSEEENDKQEEKVNQKNKQKEKHQTNQNQQNESSGSGSESEPV